MSKTLTDMTTDLRKLTGASATAELLAGANGLDQEAMRAQASRLIGDAVGADVKRSLKEIGDGHRQALQDLSLQQRDYLGQLVEAVERGLEELHQGRVILEQQRQELASVEVRAEEVAVVAVERSLLPAIERLLARHQQALRAMPAAAPARPKWPVLSPLMMAAWGASLIVALVAGALLARPEAVLAMFQVL